jgi:tetratricopeptide (TPR) repeat protein
MRQHRSIIGHHALVWLVILFLCSSIPFIARAAGTVEKPSRGWDDIWQQRTSLDQAELLRGYRLEQQGRHKEALAIVDKVLARDPNNWLPHFVKAAILSQMQKREPALKELDWALNLATKSAPPQVVFVLCRFKALINLALGRNRPALEALEQSIKMKQDDVFVLNNLAWVLATAKEADLRDPTRALSYAKKCCDLTQWSSATALDTLAAAEAATGKMADAVKYERQAVARIQPAERRYALAAMQAREQLYLAGRSYVE